jgi:hypothetical protein
MPSSRPVRARRGVIGFALGAFAAAWPEHTASAQCRGASSAILSEARATRWLVGDDFGAQSLIDADRWAERDYREGLGAREPMVHVFGATLGSVQALTSTFPVCSSHGDAEATFRRFRVVGVAGVTDAESGFHLRVSFVGAQDDLHVGANDEDDPDATSGYRQPLVAARVGHERWGKVLFGYVAGERAFREVGAEGLTLYPDATTSRAPGYFYGVTVPALRTSLVTLSQRGTPELVSVTTSDLRLPGAPVSASLGPTFIREERQVVGMLRLRGDSQLFGKGPRREVHEDEDDGTITTGTATTAGRLGPMFEVSVESRSARLRHARLRYEAATRRHFLSEEHNSWSHVRAEVYGEGTVFRSRFFSESLAGSTGQERGAAWGGGLGVHLGVGLRPIFLGLDFHTGVNRPELLALLPSAADRIEVQGALVLRFEH